MVDLVAECEPQVAKLVAFGRLLDRLADVLTEIRDGFVAVDVDHHRLEAHAVLHDRSSERDSEGGDDTWVWVGVGIGAAVAIGVAVGVAVAVTSSETGPLYEGNLGDGMVRF